MSRARTAVLAAATLFASSSSMAADSVTLFGYLNTDIENVRASGGAGIPSTWRESNNLSFWGMKGTEDLGGGWRAFFQIQGNIFVNRGAGGVNDRDTYVGLAGPYGQLSMGFQLTPYRASTCMPIDPFFMNTIAGANSIMGNGFFPGGNAQGDSSFDRRQANGVLYTSPNWHGVTAQVMYSLPNEKTATQTPSLLSTSLAYQSGSVYLSYAYEQHNSYFGHGTMDYGQRFGAAYTYGSLSVRGAAERLHYEPTPSTYTNRWAWQLAAVYQWTVQSIKVSYIQAQAATGNATVPIGGIGRPGVDSGARQIALGYDYALSRRTTLCAIFSRLMNRSGTSYNYSTNPLPGQVAGMTLTGFGVGIAHSF
ncbi:putative porin [Paraburkholderia sp. GAS448]|uniref:porin n=1 Tax=Paraburkholderia sp. GAS448 TaxID=3035136 RepID=UPI003D2268D2